MARYQYMSRLYCGEWGREQLARIAFWWVSGGEINISQDNIVVSWGENNISRDSTVVSGGEIKISLYNGLVS